MKPRERVLCALNKEKTDRPPMQISYTNEFRKRLVDDIEKRENKSLSQLCDDKTHNLERYLGQDMLLTGVPNDYEGQKYIDKWGVGYRLAPYKTKFGDGTYAEIDSSPITDESKIDSMIAPNPNIESMYDNARELVQNYKKDYFIVGTVAQTIFEMAWAMRGLDKLLMDFAIDRDFADKVLDVPHNYNLTVAKKLAEIGVDMVWLGDDMGGQNTMMISPDMWRDIFKPRMATYISELKSINKDLKVAYHSCGFIEPIIADLIEIGLDVLNPIQPASMNPAEIKNKYGDKLSFWGTIDEQYTLPFGSEEEVRKETILRRETVGIDGGLILGPTHNVQLDTPLENFYAMLEEIKRVL